MFQSARLKLTAWYLAIIMCISLFFSFAIYSITTREIEDRLRHVFIQMQGASVFFPSISPSQLNYSDEVELAQQNIRNLLLEINGVIFFVSGAAAYFLAGRTLKPIQTMVDEQNRFVSDASHELRTPLTSLRTSIEVALRDEKMTLHEAREILVSNLEDIEGLQSLSNNLLLLAQFPQHTKEKPREEISLKDVLQKAIKHTSHLASKKEISLKLSLSDQRIIGNKETLCELFVIFLDNAIKYSREKTEIAILVKKTDSSAAIRIIDQGEGIATKDLPHIFDRFYRADVSRAKGSKDGYGLGLSIAKKIIDEYHGSVDVTSHIGKGSTFTIKLPIR